VKIGIADAENHPAWPSTPIVAFDFDGTLTVRDSFNAFLHWRRGSLRAALTAATLLPAAGAYLIHRDRGRLKSALVGAFLGGVALETASEEANRFARATAKTMLRPDALACWSAWREKSVRVVIVTASPEFLVRPFAEQLGADQLVATRLSVDSLGRFTGDLDGGNCRGPEKVVRLKALFGPRLDLEAAYGDTDGDAEMLAAARRPGFRVFSGKP
jgi:phosphatidylglycerophosphatase C